MIIENNLELFNKAFMESLSELDTMGKPKYNFYIPSKARHDVIMTHTLLKNIGLSCSIIVEPNDEQKYKDALPEENILVMDKNSMGIYYVRNWIKDYSRSLGEAYHWQLDDDIKSLKYIFKGTRYKIEDYKPFSFAEAVLDKTENIGMAGFIHSAFAFSSTKEYSLNKQICTCTIVKNDTPQRWRPDIIEDTDYSLQLLYGGYCTMNINIFSYENPPAMKLKGGNFEDFQNQGFYKRQVKLSEEYPGYFTMVEKNGISRVRPSKIWSRFKNEPILK